MSKGSFTSLAAPPIQLPAFGASHPSSVGTKGPLMLCRFVRPASAFLPPLRNVSSKALFAQSGQQTVVVITLVHHYFLNPRCTARQHQVGFRQGQCVRPAARI